MATYAIGDLQGCYDELLDLLKAIQYDRARDRLWFCGDLVNRGPKSLECLRFVMQCGTGAQAVLGNHDLHLLAVAAGAQQGRADDTLQAVLEADDAPSCLEWLRARPFMVHDETTDFYMLHAGVHPHWRVQDAMALAEEVCQALRGRGHEEFIHALYGNAPARWSPTLRGTARLRCIVNSLTRMRYLDREARMTYDNKAAPGSRNDGTVPWYRFPGRKSADSKLIFGHWSTVTLGTKEDFPRHRVYPLDTGCLWGGRLSALRLEDECLFSVPSRQKRATDPRAPG